MTDAAFGRRGLLVGAGALALIGTGQPPDDATKKKGVQLLSDDKLAELVEGLGYEVTKTKGADNAVTVQFKLPLDGWTFSPIIEISPDKSFIWLWSGLQKLPDPANPPPLVLLRLLNENERDNRFFSINAKSGTMRLYAVIPNQNVTPASLRREIEGFKKRIDLTEELWNPKRWPAAKP